MKIAIVGAGISGMVAAYLLSRRHEVTVFEANDYIGGHTHTIPVRSNGTTYPVDTGFVVFNNLNYPNFSRLLESLGVPSEPTQMSFSMKCERSGMEYKGTSLNSLFAQRSNLLRPRFYRMLLDILRFYREAPALLKTNGNGPTLGEFMDRHGYSEYFVDKHIIPMISAVWSADRAVIREFPARYFVQFFYNHGFLQVSRRPQWRVITGGSHEYVKRLTARYRDNIRLRCPIQSIQRQADRVSVKPRRGDAEEFDTVVLATHSDQALRLLVDPSERERDILSRIAYQRSEVVLHTDAALLPRRPLARASWNYHITREPVSAPTITYYMNSLQNFRSKDDFCVTLNRTEAIQADRRIHELIYHHPVYTDHAIGAQKRHQEINGVNRTHYCGAYWGYGFHEDGVNSALKVCKQFGERL